MKRYALPVYLYISVWFHNYALVYRTWDGAIFSIHSFQGFSRHLSRDEQI